LCIKMGSLSAELAFHESYIIDYNIDSIDGGSAAGCLDCFFNHRYIG